MGSLGFYFYYHKWVGIVVLMELITLVPPLPRTDRHRLAGVVTVNGVPSQRRVAVMNRTTLAVYAFTLSHPTTGAWEVKGLPEYQERSLIVLAQDDNGSFNAEITDYISQVTA